MKKTILIFSIICLMSACNNSKDNSDEITITKDKQDSINKALEDQAKEIKKLNDEKRKKQNQEVAENKRSIIENIDTYLHSTPDYRYSELGGISDGKIHVQNLTNDITFQKAVVQVQIILDNGKIFTTDFYTIENIEPGEVKSIQVPKTNRGTSVRAKVIKIKSKELTDGKLVDSF